MTRRSKLDIESYVNTLAETVLSNPQPAEEQEAGKELDAAAPSLKGHAVELWRDGSRFFLVADEEDAHEAMRRFGAGRGEV